MSRLKPSGPVCYFGRPSPIDPEWPGPHHCAGCVAAVQQAVAAFQADVTARIYDAEGYTPAERRAEARKAALKGLHQISLFAADD